MRAGTNSRYRMGKSPPIKAEWQELTSHLETRCSRFITSTRRRTCSSAGLGRSQQVEIPPSLNSKQAACFSSFTSFSMNTGISPGAEISTPARILPSACFSLAARILPSACFSLAERILSSAWLLLAARILSSARLYWLQAFVHIFQCLHFWLFFHIFIKCAPIFWIGAIISGL